MLTLSDLAPGDIIEFAHSGVAAMFPPWMAIVRVYRFSFYAANPSKGTIVVIPVDFPEPAKFELPVEILEDAERITKPSALN